MKTTKVSFKAKAFSKDPSILQQFSDVLHNQYGKLIATSRPLPTAEGDFYLLVTVYSEES